MVTRSKTTAPKTAAIKATKAAPVKAPTKKVAPRQTQSADAGQGKQGAGTSGKGVTDTTEVRGGAKQVLITEAKITGRGGRPAGIEEYPFGELTPARKDAEGNISGPSFFIPDSDRAIGRLAAARKRHKGLFWSRKVSEKVNDAGPKVPGLRIWRGTPELAREV